MSSSLSPTSGPSSLRVSTSWISDSLASHLGFQRSTRYGLRTIDEPCPSFHTKEQTNIPCCFFSRGLLVRSNYERYSISDSCPSLHRLWYITKEWTVQHFVSELEELVASFVLIVNIIFVPNRFVGPSNFALIFCLPVGHPLLRRSV